MDMELLNLEGLTTEERTIILNVIRRDDELRRRQDNRISQLKGEIHNLRMNSVLRGGDDLSKMCARCKSPFGMVTNTGDVCPACRFKVCKNCRERLLSRGWMCVLCFKENQMKWLTGDWMPKDKKQTAHNLNATDLVRASLRVKHANDPDAADNFQIPAINRSRQSDGDHASGSEYSGHGSPDKLRGSSQHLSPPSIVTSHTGSLDEQRSGDDDDIDELFAKHRMRGSLGVSRSSLGKSSDSSPSPSPDPNLLSVPGSARDDDADSRESLASVYSDAGEINYGRIPVTGDIVFGLDYDHKKSALVITIKGCHDLAPVDVKHNRSDPYVKAYLLPDKTRSGKRKSKIKKHTLSPVYNEALTYNISRGELENRTLWVTVWHSDRFGRNDFLGEVLIPMDTYRFDDPSPRAYTLQTRMQENISEEAMQYKGDLVVSLMYVTPDHADGPNNKKSKSKSKKSKSASQPQGEIHCMIKAAKNLTAVRSNGASDPFVKGYLLPDRTRTGKQKTSVVKNSVNPTWNHNLVFDGVEKEELADRCLELTVWDHEKLGTNEFLGGARLNLGHGTVKGSQVEWMDARGEEVTAWQSMIESPNTWIDARLPLRASMGKPSKK